MLQSTDTFMASYHAASESHPLLSKSQEEGKDEAAEGILTTTTSSTHNRAFRPIRIIICSGFLIIAFFALLCTPPPKALQDLSKNIAGLFTKSDTALDDKAHDSYSELFESSTDSTLIHKNWKGWSNIEYLFVFGDSYTAWMFDIDGKQPSSSRPIGNSRVCDRGFAKPYPDCIPKKWPLFLSWTYNASTMLTYNFAFGGSTIVALPDEEEGHRDTFDNQVNNKFIKHYTPPPTYAPWTATNSIFTIMFGINDLIKADQNAPIERLIKNYTTLIEKLYKAGARNLLLLNTPPFDISQAHRGMQPAEKAKKKAIEKENIQKFNQAHATMCAEIRAKYTELTLFRFDVNRVYRDAVADVTKYEQTASIKELEDTRSHCRIDQHGKPMKHPHNCDRPEEEFFWTGLHPTYPIHNLTAALIVSDCFVDGVAPKGYCSWG